MTSYVQSQDENMDDSSEIVLINVVQVDEGKQADALDVLRTAVTYVAQNYPGFQWSRLYKSVDGKTVVNQAKWHSKQEFDSLFEDPEFLARYNKLKETGHWEFHLYQVTDLITSECTSEGIS